MGKKTQICCISFIWLVVMWHFYTQNGGNGCFVLAVSFASVAGIKKTLGHRTWPNLFATWSVINFPNSSIVQSFCEQKIENYLVPFKVSRYFINKVEVTNPKDVYLPRNITNNVCVQFLAGHHFFCL